MPPWAKVLWWITETVIYGAVHDQFDYGAEITPLKPGDPQPATTWRKFICEWEDTVSQDPADTQQLSFELVNYTNGSIDNSWTSGDYTQVETALTPFFANLSSSLIGRLKVTKVSSYIRQFNDMSNAKPFADSGPPEWVWTPNVAMTGAGTMPPQVSTTITELTASRANWGRFYLPTLAPIAFATSGRLATQYVDGFAGAAHTLYNTLYGDQLVPVVPTTSVQKNWSRTLQSVSAVQCDDVSDVHRSRRFKATAYRRTDPIP